MIDSFNNIGMDKIVSSIYDFGGMSEQETWSKFAQKINIIIEHFNYLDKKFENEKELNKEKLDYLLGEGLTEQVAKELLEKILDGTIGKLINETLLKDINNKVDNFKEEVNEQLDTKTQQLENEKATREELSIERNRISAIIQLPNGSTTGDAELMDGRITLLGNKEQTIGDSIRNQFKSILSSNSFSKSYNFDDNFNGVLMELSGDFIKGQNTMIILNGESGVLNESATINIGLKTINDELINDFLTIQANKIVEFIMPQNCKMFRCWIPSSAKKSNGVVTLTIGYKLNLYETLNKNYESLITQKELIDYCLKFESGENGYIYDDIYNISVLDGYDIDSSTPCNYKKDEIVYFYLENDGSVKDNVIFYFANTYENGDGSIEEIANEIALNPNTEFKFQFPKKCTKIRWWVSKSNVIKDGNIKLTVKSYRRNGFKNYFEENVDKLNEKVNNTSKLTFSILGDSYSAYPKWIEEGYASWYNDNGNTDTNNMTSFTQMWWYLLMQETGYALLRNESYSGTTISTTGYSGNDSTATSFTTRMKKGMGEERTLEPKPNIIFALGGQNDTWANSPIGDVKYSGWTTEDLKSTLPAFCYMIDYLKKWNPQARIINIMSDELKPTIKSGMITACNYYNVEYVQLTNISKENGHPSQQGMKDIKSQIIKIL